MLTNKLTDFVPCVCSPVSKSQHPASRPTVGHMFQARVLRNVTQTICVDLTLSFLSRAAYLLSSDSSRCSPSVPTDLPTGEEVSLNMGTSLLLQLLYSKGTGPRGCHRLLMHGLDGQGSRGGLAWTPKQKRKEKRGGQTHPRG